MRTLTAACVMILSMGAPAFALDMVTPAEKSAFLVLENQLWTAWNAKLKPADAAAFYSQKPDNLYFNLTPLKFTGWAEFERVMTPALATGAVAKMVINDDFTVTRSGNLVVTAFTFTTSFEGSANAPQGISGRMTDVWTQEGGRWVLIHQHMSAPMGGMAAAK